MNYDPSGQPWKPNEEQREALIADFLRTNAVPQNKDSDCGNNTESEPKSTIPSPDDFITAVKGPGTPMTPDLFNLPPTLSPRLQWLAKHRLETAYDAGLAAEGEPLPHSCYSLDNGGGIAVGASETEAIYAYCERYGLKHWSLEA